MDEDGAILVDLLQVDDEFCRIMLGVGEDLCAKEGDDMIRNYRDRLAAEVSIVDAQLGVKPGDFVRDELPWDEALQVGPIKIECGVAKARSPTLDATSA
jgi:hypothetical protein